MIETMHTKSLEFGLDFLRRGLNFFVFETKNFFRRNTEASKILLKCGKNFVKLIAITKWIST